MFGLLCKRLPFSLSNGRRVVANPMVQLQYLIRDAHKTSLTAKQDKQHQKNHSFVESFLIKSCGLSPETAKSASKKTHFELPEKPDSVLRFLRDNGFTDTQISKIVRKCPPLLVANPEKTLLPKFEFFRSIGISIADLPRIFCRNPTTFFCSLEESLIPKYNFLKSVLLLDEKVVSALKCSSWILVQDLQKTLAPNISVLKGIGVPQSMITVLITTNPNAVCSNAEKFCQEVKKVIEMGFDPSKMAFVKAIVALRLSKSTWEHKMEVYKRWGWSDDEILLAFRKQPVCMTLSEKKIMTGMDVLVNKMGLQASYVANNSNILFYSLEKRIIPRCSVIKVLQLRGLIRKDVSLATVLAATERNFLDKFVIKYQEHVPQLRSIYQSNLGFQELDF